MRNIPALDGYRGIAVLLVMLYHGGVMPHGWAGVQLFFILSSFLVTTVLRSQKNAPDYYAGFLRRRARRLFPLYFLYFALAVPLLARDLPPEALAGLATFTFNFTQIFFPLTGSYAFGHFWSLAIEMQFYLVWPAFVRRLDDRALRRLALAMVLVAPAARFGGDLLLARIAPTLDPSASATFFIPFSHLDAFGWGALLALPRVPDPRAWIVGLCAGAVSLGCAPFASRKIWTFAVVALAGAILFRAALSPRFGRLFCPTWLQFTGRISYGLYVWHHILIGWILSVWPVSAFSLPGLARLAGILAGSYLVASVSFYAWERRFLGRGHWTSAIFRRRDASPASSEAPARRPADVSPV